MGNPLFLHFKGKAPDRCQVASHNKSTYFHRRSSPLQPTHASDLSPRRAHQLPSATAPPFSLVRVSTRHPSGPFSQRERLCAPVGRSHIACALPSQKPPRGRYSPMPHDWKLRPSMPAARATFSSRAVLGGPTFQLNGDPNWNVPRVPCSST